MWINEIRQFSLSSSVTIELDLILVLPSFFSTSFVHLTRRLLRFAFISFSCFSFSVGSSLTVNDFRGCVCASVPTMISESKAFRNRNTQKTIEKCLHLPLVVPFLTLTNDREHNLLFCLVDFWKCRFVLAIGPDFQVCRMFWKWKKQRQMSIISRRKKQTRFFGQKQSSLLLGFNSASMRSSEVGKLRFAWKNNASDAIFATFHQREFSFRMLDNTAVVFQTVFHAKAGEMASREVEWLQHLQPHSRTHFACSHFKFCTI